MELVRARDTDADFLTMTLSLRVALIGSTRFERKWAITTETGRPFDFGGRQSLESSIYYPA